MQKGLFVISLDFELFWGVRDKRTIASYGENILGVQKVIPALLHLFERYNIHATFATVGFLFTRNKTELKEYIPAVLPAYSIKNYSPYENSYIDSIGYNEQDDKFHYAESLIRLLQQHPQHEIASHTFSHFYCLEGASVASFEADMLAAKKIAATYSVDLKSIVFPRNQYSQDHIAICKKLGFTSFRGNEQSAFYTPRKNTEQNRNIRAVRLADSYFNLTGHHTFSIRAEEDIINIPASRFLRPYNPKLKIFDSLRLQRIKSSLAYAAQNNQAFHLWWHPHNFGRNLQENINFLEVILKQYKKLNQQFGMESRTMKEIASKISINHAL